MIHIPFLTSSPHVFVSVCACVFFFCVLEGGPRCEIARYITETRAVIHDVTWLRGYLILATDLCSNNYRNQ